MRDKTLVFGSPLIGQDEIDYVVDSLQSGWLGTGPKVKSFETKLLRFLCPAVLTYTSRAGVNYQLPPKPKKPANPLPCESFL